MTNPDLKPILSGVVSGDENAFREIFERFSPKVHAFALKLTHSSALAEEIVQDVFLKVWLTRESLASINYFPSYLYTITRNHTFNILKKIALEERIKEAMRNEVPDEPNENEVVEKYQHILIDAVSQLPPQQKLVYSLCHQKGLKYEEVAEQLNISRLTVKTHMQKALRSIRLHFKGAISVLFFIGSNL